MKEKTRERLKRGQENGDAYCFTAIDPETKLMLCYHVGKREADDADWFCHKLASATSGHFQVTTDGFKPYCTAMIEAFRWRIDFAQYIKLFQGGGQADARYSPGTIRRVAKRVRAGNPDPDKISTSIVERSNLTIRMTTRRMTRLTNAFSKLWDNHEAALALFFMAYNFVTVHGTLKTTPAVAHGLTDHVWSVEELLGVLAKYA
ncbi:MAG TPA: IS1 family transposase [Pirellulales bacterium]|jgi:IS1 family transposase|nr:IS1 family transposase [Pirellulales bacterium]